MVYFDKFARYRKKSLIIYADYDLTFLRSFRASVFMNSPATTSTTKCCTALRPLHDRRNPLQIPGWVAARVVFPNGV